MAAGGRGGVRRWNLVLKRGRGGLILVGAYALCAGACGNGLASGNSGNEAMFTFGAALAPGDSLPPTARLGVLWTDLLQRQPDVPMPPSWFSSTLGADTPQGFLINFYRLPPAAALFRIDTSDGDSIEMAFGEIVIFDDAGGDGGLHIDGPHAEMAPPGSYLAGTADAIIYVARPFSSGRDGFPLGPSLSAGYTTLFFDCHGTQVVDEIRQNVGVQFVLQPSQDLPEIRTCMRTHSP
jgi:hypothetical protein